MTFSEMPSNIALIKYMGKEDSSVNRPTNPSISYTLNHLVTRVEAERIDENQDQWTPLLRLGFTEMQLSEKGLKRYLDFFAKLKSEFGIEGNFRLKSANNFPSDCGLASSASSFAAITDLAAKISERQNLKRISNSERAQFSMQGSGSSCRSFFSPFAVWRGLDVSQVELPFSKLLHQVVVVEDGIKSVSSSEAHLRIQSSLNFQGRIERATQRADDLIRNLKSQNWREAYEICWAEFWDMHALFETSNPSFGYMTSGSLKVLEFSRSEWAKRGDGPLVTMDAGPNVHLLFREDQKAMYSNFKEKLGSKYKVIGSLDFEERPT